MKQIILFLYLLLLSTATAFSQGPPPPDGGGVDDVVPIDDHIWILVVLAFLVGVFYITKSRLTQTSK